MYILSDEQALEMEKREQKERIEKGTVTTLNKFVIILEKDRLDELIIIDMYSELSTEYIGRLTHSDHFGEWHSSEEAVGKTVNFKILCDNTKTVSIINKFIKISEKEISEKKVRSGTFYFNKNFLQCLKGRFKNKFYFKDFLETLESFEYEKITDFLSKYVMKKSCKYKSLSIEENIKKEKKLILKIDFKIENLTENSEFEIKLGD